MTRQRIILLILIVTALGNAVMAELNHRKFVTWDAKMDEVTAEYRKALVITDETILR